jgi:hypothetical protein
MDLKLDAWRWKIYRWNEHPNPFQGRPDLALEWLSKSGADSLTMTQLRGLLSDSGNHTVYSRDDKTVLDEIARRLSTGELHLGAEFRVPGPEAEEIFFVEPDVTVSPGIFAPPPPVQPPPDDPATLPPTVNQVLAAQCLQNASDDGSAFCAECPNDSQSQGT